MTLYPRAAPAPTRSGTAFARRTTTLLTGHGKLTGKTTLLSILLSRRARGGQLAGLAVNPGKTIIVSEERPLVVELNADATDYVQVVETAPDEFERYYQALRMVLEDAPQKLTRGDILAEWPADFDKPSGTTLKTWLGRAVERGIIVCEGTGRKADPYRYFLQETEAKWREKMGPELYDLLHEQECKFGWKSLQEKKALDREYDMSSTGAAGGDDAI